MSKKYSYAQEQCIRSAGKVMQQTEMLWPNCKVGVALSGGVDSFVLLKVLQIRQGIVPFHFDLLALHLNPGFDPLSHKNLQPWLIQAGIASHLELTDYGLQAHSDLNRRKSPCFRCAWLRRKHLFTLASQYHLTHLAFGHNADDLISTFFLNLCNNGRVQGLSLKEAFFRGELQLIRPLLMVPKKTIKTAAKQWQLPVVTNICPSVDLTKRKVMQDSIMDLCKSSSQARSSIYNALTKWQFDQDLQNVLKENLTVEND